MTIFGFLTKIGTKNATSASEKRNVILSNYTAIISCMAIYLLMAGLVAYYGLDKFMILRLFVASLFFAIPLLLNALGVTKLSRIILSWLVPFVVFTMVVMDLKQGEQMSSSSFVGLRLFLVASACFPFLFFSIREKTSLVLAFSIPIISIVCFDRIISMFGVTYLSNAANDRFYEFNNVRAIISFLAVFLSLFFLRKIIEQNEYTNEQLLRELEEKNKLLEKNAAEEVNQLNMKLKRQLDELTLSEEKFRGTFEYSAMGMALVSRNGDFIKVNRQLCQMLGYGDHGLVGLNIRSISLLHEVDHGLAMVQSLVEKPDSVVRQVRTYIHKNGSLVFVNLTVALIRAALEKPMFFSAQFEDITQQLSDNKKLTIYEANIKATINNTDIFIWSVDRTYKLLMFNEAFAAHMLKKYNIMLEVGKSVFQNPDSDIARPLVRKWSEFYRIALSGERLHFEENRHGIDFQYSLSPIVENNEIIGVSIFANNITEQKLRDKRLADADKKIGELKLMALGSVMSPHFIYNVLNSIQFFIAKNDRKNALNYLTSFSKHMRNVLNHSIKSKITVDEELEALQTYIKLEQMRFENRFSFDLQVDKNVDCKGKHMPSLLIQPYVENAIIHGLVNGEEPGLLSITVTEQNEGVMFRIRDNGIGRKAAEKLKKDKVHVSMGTNITAERLALINKIQHASVEIFDLYDGDAACGTEVSVYIALTD